MNRLERRSSAALALMTVLLLWVGALFAWRTSKEAVLATGLATGAGTLLWRRWRTNLRDHADEVHAAQSAALERNRELELLGRFAGALLVSQTRDELFQRAAEAAAGLVHADVAAICILVEEGRFLRVAAAHGVTGAANRLIPVDQTLAGQVIAQGDPVRLNDLARVANSFSLNDETTHRSLMLVPLRTAGMVIGVIATLDRSAGAPAEFGQHDTELLEVLAEQVAMGLDRATALDESRRSEVALAAKNRELVRATKLKGEFLANMSHELRTPLNAIIGFSDLLLTEGMGPLNDAQRDFLASISRNGTHLLGLINNVLDLSKIEAGRMTQLLVVSDLRDAIRGAVADTASLRAAKHQTSRVEMDDVPLRALADRQRVRQILFNLLSNASKFTPEGGQITLSALLTQAPLPVPSDRTGERAKLANREAVWISVRDTGMGITPNDMSKLFVEFSQVDSSASRRQQGTGLGLALCKQFVDMHGGTIGAESVPEHGSAFWFLLPVDGPVRRGV